jgi:molybdenum cofactor synthesis domain-containing protein
MTRPEAPAQNQFLTVVSRDEAVARFAAAFRPEPLGSETVVLDASFGRVASEPVRSPVDVPPFDRSVVDGFAVAANDLAGASDGDPVGLTLGPEHIHCGFAPRIPVTPGTAVAIATGGPLPRGADSVVMIEHTVAGSEGVVLVRRSTLPGQGVAFAGSDIAAGETLLMTGSVITAREIGLLAACGIHMLRVHRRPRIGIISTGDELVEAGRPLPPASIYDTNSPILGAAVREIGGEAVRYGVIRDDPAALSAAMRRAHAECDMVILSGGTSKGEGDFTYRTVKELGPPGLIVHGVALKPGKPLGLAVCDGKPVVLLPGFPTSAMFTFHDIVAPVIRRMAGLPVRTEATVKATVSQRVASDIGRTEYVSVALAAVDGGLVAHPVGKGSGAITSFVQADGFVTVPALVDSLPGGTEAVVRLFGDQVRVPDLVIAGSHCTGLDVITSALVERGLTARVVATGSLGGLQAVMRNECDLAPIHLLHPETGTYNRPWLGEGLDLVRGWRRMQGIVHRPGDPRFEGRSPEEAIAAALADKACLMVNRNQGSGTRIIMDRLLEGLRPAGYQNQPRSHNAVAAAVRQGRADWGIAIEPVARFYGLGFIPIGPEHYDFAVVAGRKARPAVAAFFDLLRDPAVRDAVSALGFEPSEEQ